MKSITGSLIKEKSKEDLNIRGLSVKDFLKGFRYWRPYNMTIEIAGNTVIKTDFEKVGFEGGNGGGGRKVGNGKPTSKEDRDKVLYKMSKRIIGYVNANFYDRFMVYRFLTLEFLKDIKDIKTANIEFKKFIQRLRSKYGDLFMYLAMIDFHTGEKNPEREGVIHYHMISDIDYLEFEKLGKIWGNGFVWIEQAYSVDNIGKYLRGYLDKKIYDPRLEKEKAYLRSGNLKPPLKLYGVAAWKYWEKNKEILLPDLTWKDAYRSENRGIVEVKEFIKNQTAVGKKARQKKLDEHYKKLKEKEELGHE